MKISKLHYITQDFEDVSHSDLAGQVCKGGADWIQLRVKNKPEAEWEKIATETKNICEKYNARLIINDNVNIAKKIEAYGVHLGKNDMQPIDARKYLGKNFIIGATANTYEDIARLVNSDIDYIGLGPFRFTSTKDNISPVIGLDGYKNILEQCRKNNINITIIAIGGITVDDVKSLLNTGVYGIAVSSAINLSQNRVLKTKEFLGVLNNL